MTTELDALRERLDAIDRQLVRLLEERLEVSRQVGLYKQRQGLPVLDRSREQQVLASRAAQLQNPDYAPQLRSCFEEIMHQSRVLQQQVCHRHAVAVEASSPRQPQALAVAYSGVPGSYAEEAALGFFGREADLRQAPSFEGACRMLQQGEVQRAVLPIENSSTGAISAVYDLLIRYGLYLVGEQYVRVQHCLLAKPGTRLEEIREVYSHEQGLGQSKEFLARHPQWRTEALYNTAAAAKLVSESPGREKAAIASRRAGELYGLEVLAERTNFKENNYTRFVVASVQPEWPGDSDKVSLAFTLPHTSGSLYEVLGLFARRRLNLMKIESRPVPQRNWEYFFFLDFATDRVDDSLQQALDEVAGLTRSMRLLGCYRAADTEEESQ